MSKVISHSSAKAPNSDGTVTQRTIRRLICASNRTVAVKSIAIGLASGSISLHFILEWVLQAVEAALAALSEDDLKCFQCALEREAQFLLGEHVITSAMVEIKPEQRKVSGRQVNQTSSIT